VQLVFSKAFPFLFLYHLPLMSRMYHPLPQRTPSSFFPPFPAAGMSCRMLLLLQCPYPTAVVPSASMFHQRRSLKCTTNRLPSSPHVFPFCSDYDCTTVCLRLRCCWCMGFVRLLSDWLKTGYPGGKTYYDIEPNRMNVFCFCGVVSVLRLLRVVRESGHW